MVFGGNDGTDALDKNIYFEFNLSYLDAIEDKVSREYCQLHQEGDGNPPKK